MIAKFNSLNMENAKRCPGALVKEANIVNLSNFKP